MAHTQRFVTKKNNALGRIYAESKIEPTRGH